jgi:hypothetical protein
MSFWLTTQNKILVDALGRPILSSDCCCAPSSLSSSSSEIVCPSGCWRLARDEGVFYNYVQTGISGTLNGTAPFDTPTTVRTAATAFFDAYDITFTLNSPPDIVCDTSTASITVQFAPVGTPPYNAVRVGWNQIGLCYSGGGPSSMDPYDFSPISWSHTLTPACGGNFPGGFFSFTLLPVGLFFPYIQCNWYYSFRSCDFGRVTGEAFFPGPDEGGGVTRTNLVFNES